MSDDNDKLKKFVESLSVVHGEGSIFLPSFLPLATVEWIPIDIFQISDAFGNGIPVGEQIEIFGPESSGKTTLTLELIKYAQKYSEKSCAFIDFENALDPEYARNIGVNLDSLPISQPETAEKGLSILLEMCASGLFSIIVVDSVASMVPRALLDGEPGDHHIGVHAKLMSDNVRKIRQICRKNGTTVIWTNQLRYKIGVVFGNPETTPGGNALKFYSTIRCDIRKIETLTDKSGPIGIMSRVKIVKNKVSPPFKEAKINIIWGKGIDVGSGIAEKLEKDGRLVRRGPYYYLDCVKGFSAKKSKKEDGGLQIGTGKLQANDWLTANFEKYESDIANSPGKRGGYYECIGD